MSILPPHQELSEVIDQRLGYLARDLATNDLASSNSWMPEHAIKRVLEVATGPMFSERLRGIMEAIDEDSSYERGPERLPLFAETCTIYGCKERPVKRVAEDFGLTDPEVIQFAASVTYGERSIVVLQQRLLRKSSEGLESDVFVYIYNEEPALGESSMVFYQAPNILGSI